MLGSQLWAASRFVQLQIGLERAFNRVEKQEERIGPRPHPILHFPPLHTSHPTGRARLPVERQVHLLIGPPPRLDGGHAKAALAAGMAIFSVAGAHALV